MRPVFLQAFNVIIATVIAFSLASRAYHITGRTISKTIWILSFITTVSVMTWLIGRCRLKPTWRMLVLAGLAGFLGSSGSAISTRHLDGNLWIFGPGLHEAANWLLPLADSISWMIGFAILFSGIQRLWGQDPIDPPRSWPWIPIVGTMLAVIHIAIYMARERWVPFWDYGLYWGLSADLANSNSVSDAGVTVRDSIRHLEYHSLPAVPSAIAIKLFGDSWWTYLLSVVVVWGGAVMIVLHSVVDRAWAASSAVGRWWPTLLAVTFPILWVPTVRGYLDLGGVAFGLGALGCLFTKPISQMTLRDATWLGFCLAGLFLFRRWYSILAVAIVFVAASDWLIAMIRSRGRNTIRLTRGLLLAGIIATAILVSFAWPMLMTMAGNRFADAYTAYRIQGTAWDRLHAFFATIGYVFPLIFAGMAFIGWSVPSLRRLTTACVAVAIIAHVLFHRIQDLSIHHKLLYAPCYMLLVGAVGRALIEWRTWIVIPFVGLHLLGFIGTFEPWAEPMQRRLEPLVARHPIYPVVRHDLDSISQAIDRANAEALSKNTRFAVIASSTTINQYLVRNFHRATRTPRPGDWRLQLYPEVDKTGWYPKELFEVDVYLAADPVQFHLPKHEQHIVGIATEMLLNRVGIGASCREVGEAIVIDNGVSLRLFVRERTMTADERNQFRDRLKAAHPDWPKLHGE